MSKFLDDLKIEQVGWTGGRAKWSTLADLRYQSDLLGRTIRVPAEFVTDLASVPRLPVVWLLAGGRGDRAAVVHDFAYQFGYWVVEGAQHEWPCVAVEKRLVDSVFREALLADPMSGVGHMIASLMWLGVRLGGRGVWAQRGPRTASFNPIWSRQFGVRGCLPLLHG